MDHDKSTQVIALTGELDIERADEVKAKLLEAFATGQDIALEISEVEFVHTAAWQVLLAARREADASGRRLLFVMPAEGVVRSAAAIGIAASSFGSMQGGSKQGETDAA